MIMLYMIYYVKINMNHTNIDINRNINMNKISIDMQNILVDRVGNNVPKLEFKRLEMRFV